MKTKLFFILSVFLMGLISANAQGGIPEDELLEAPDCRKDGSVVISTTTWTWIGGIPVPMTCSRTKTTCYDTGDVSYGEWECEIGFGSVEGDLRDYDNLAFNDSKFDKDFQGRSITTTAEAFPIITPRNASFVTQGETYTSSSFIPAPGTCNACRGGKQVCATKDRRIYTKDCGPDQFTDTPVILTDSQSSTTLNTGYAEEEVTSCSTTYSGYITEYIGNAYYGFMTTQSHFPMAVPRMECTITRSYQYQINMDTGLVCYTLTSSSTSCQ